MENSPGAVPARGTFKDPVSIWTDRGPNALLAVHSTGKFVVAGTCAAQSVLELFGLESGERATTEVEIELSDRPGVASSHLLPPGSPSVTEMASHLHAIVSAESAPNANLVVSTAGCSARAFRVDLASGRLVRHAVFGGGNATMVRVACSHDGTLVLGADESGAIRVWGSSTECLHVLKLSRAPTAVSFAWNDMLGMAGDDLGRVIGWDLSSGKRHLQFQAHRAAVLALRFSEERAALLTAGADFAARLWNLSDGGRIGRDLVHRGLIHDACFVAGGRYVVTAGADGHVGLWSTSDGALLDWVFEGKPVYRVAWSQSDGRVYLGTAGALRAWSVDWNAVASLDRAVAQSANPPPAFVQPPSQPPATHTGAGGNEAPIGATFAPRATVDLPAVTRGGPPRFGRSAPPATQAMTAIGARPSTADAGAAAGAVPVRRRFAPAGVAAGASTPPEATSDVSDRRDAAHGSAGANETKPSVSVPADSPRGFDDFFAPALRATSEEPEVHGAEPGHAGAVEPLPASTPREPVDAPSSVPPSSQAPPAEQSRAGGASASPAAPASRATRPPSAVGLWFPMRSRLVLIAGLVLTIGARLGVEFWFVEKAWPEDVRERGEAAEQAHIEILSEIDEGLQTFLEERDVEIARHAANGQLSTSERDRLVLRIERRKEERRALADAERTRVEEEQRRRLEDLLAERRTAAVRMANVTALVSLLLALLAALLSSLIGLRKRT